MRKVLIVVASLAVVLGGVGLAPAAFAADETVQFSSLASGVSVSGSASMTLNSDADVTDVDFYLYLPKSLFHVDPAQFLTGGSTSECQPYGMTISFNGVPQDIDQCELRDSDNTYDPISDSYVLLVATGTLAVVGEVVTITWGSGLVTTTASLNGPTVYVGVPINAPPYNVVPIPVTPTLLPGTTSTPIPMWMQAIGRTSATATCPDGYTGSWDTWPNEGKGGYVCNRFVRVYGS